ncbi:alkaline phosphatase family protein [Oceaniglobus indicus]|uniref:alkaline phosphatase family protein n=1 Tax=Oceaniglobus indicus TaxID=2047749 RepID=UPI000C18E493|nr:alkaline phosphatase family protein [Oceaniglobus indicus]
MARAKNVLFIMCDQLRHDYLSCGGHPHLHTPHIDGLAARGVRFDRAYVQSPICGPSRMSFYTGRYVISHGSSWNSYPLKVGELTLGDHLRPLGVDTVLIGKTHMKADAEGMARYGIEPGTVIGARLAECGFDVFERDDGLHPDTGYATSPRYNDWLRARGYDDANPWQAAANSVDPEGNETGTGWFLKYSDRAAKVAEEHSETPYLTTRFMEFIDSRTDDTPWMCHLSFIKPHWPYIVPAPYHDMFGPDTWLPPVRAESERNDPHPVYKAFMDLRVSRNFSRDDVRETVLPGYMGLIKQMDDQMGRLFAFLDDRGLSDDTMIVFTSDHGDYLGDHWLGEKELFHDPSVRIPLIVYDPSPEADATRGTVSDALVEAIDLAPTFLETFGGTAQPHRLEGRSLLPLLRGENPPWRKVAISEYDYAPTAVRAALGRGAGDCRLIMAVSQRWKYVFAEGFRPMLFDLVADPQELNDLGADPACADVCSDMREHVFAWARAQRQRITMSDAAILSQSERRTVDAGILIGFWDEDELSRMKRETDADQPGRDNA